MISTHHITRLPVTLKYYKFFTTRVYDSVEEEKDLRRTIEFTVAVNKRWFVVSVSKSLEADDELMQTIVAITVILILLILGASFFTNRIVLKKLWQPFYSALYEMHRFSLSDKQKMNFSVTNIEEFSYLNSTLLQVLNKAQSDYLSLKEFRENAAHELQTPLAVIQSKLDNLIQNEKLFENESKNIQDIYQAVQNLKKLNQSLLLLVKIENNQFSEQVKLDLCKLIENKCSQFFELWNAMQATTQINIQPVFVTCNLQLVDILLNNLLSNATKHNHLQGSIALTLKHQKLILDNTSICTLINNNILFKRFSKINTGSEGYGLGLSIIKQICDVSGFTCVIILKNQIFIPSLLILKKKINKYYFSFPFFFNILVIA